MGDRDDGDGDTGWTGPPPGKNRASVVGGWGASRFFNVYHWA